MDLRSLRYYRGTYTSDMFANRLKAPWYEASGRTNRHGIIDLFTDRDPKSHAANRRKVAGLYAMSRLVKMEPQVNQVNARLVEQFKNIARRGEVINLQFWLQCYAFDVVTTITVSVLVTSTSVNLTNILAR